MTLETVVELIQNDYLSLNGLMNVCNQADARDATKLKAFIPMIGENHQFLNLDRLFSGNIF